nr:hypothetical protein [uncultured Roseateles sp.]
MQITLDAGESVTLELQRLVRLHGMPSSAHAQAEAGTDPDVLAMIEAMSRVARRPDTGDAPAQAPESDESQWRGLGDQLCAAMDGGALPSQPEVRLLARETSDRILAFGGGDQAVVAALAHS